MCSAAFILLKVGPTGPARHAREIAKWSCTKTRHLRPLSLNAPGPLGRAFGGPLLLIGLAWFAIITVYFLKLCRPIKLYVLWICTGAYRGTPSLFCLSSPPLRGSQAQRVTSHIPTCPCPGPYLPYTPGLAGGISHIHFWAL